MMLLEKHFTFSPFQAASCFHKIIYFLTLLTRCGVANLRFISHT